MKIFSVDFAGLYPVGNCLIILANDLEEAQKIALSTIMHTSVFTVREVSMEKPRVLVYISGDY